MPSSSRFSGQTGQCRKACLMFSFTMRAVTCNERESLVEGNVVQCEGFLSYVIIN